MTADPRRPADRRCRRDAAPATLRSRHLLGIDGLDAGEITLILDTAEAMKEIGTRSVKKVPTLRGRTVVNLFFEPSTRTRTSFEVAEKRLSADTLSIATAMSSVTKGESLLDTVRNIEAMAPDMIVIRHASSGAPHLLARMCRSTIVNAGDGMHEHPTQALLDAFTIRAHKKRLAGSKVAIIGDLLHSRVLRSNLLLLEDDGRGGVDLRAGDADPGRARTARRDDHDLDRRGGRRRRRGDDAADPAGADARPFLPLGARILLALRPDARAAPPRRRRRDRHASRPDEPRRRDRLRGR